jgi:type III restriction enzyme
MDKGAHFYKCDFQVHTPRDSRWVGAKAVTPEERRAYADELVKACRSKGLNAIAITDHHDFVFYPYIRAAAADESDADGNPLPLDQRLVVFPGLELTLSSPPCQAILLLDASFDETKFDHVLTTLAITPTSSSESQLASVESVSPTSITSLNDLGNRLTQQPWLKGKFIILPNVTSGGYKTLFRDGFEKHYKEMRCVGGYVDGSYSVSDTGKKNILEGRQKKNGYKPLAVFQTSDNRRRDHADLGKHPTYVKWSEPTAEALRQACLARESRISHEDPLMPTAWITSLSISNSKFLGTANIDFNQQYNVIIGGRGTGKSTILEYLRWGLCDQPVDDADVDIVQGKRKSLIDNTLQKFDGEVHVEFLLNDVPHVVKRNSKTQEIWLKIGDGGLVQASEEQVRNLLPIQAYSQKQLSNVSVRVDELRRFVQLPIKQELDRVRSELRDTAARMRSLYTDLVRLRELEAEVGQSATGAASLTEQLDKLRKGLKGLSKADEKTINLKSKFDDEEELIGALQERLNVVSENVQAFMDASNDGAEDEEVEYDIENKIVITKIRERFERKFKEIDTGIQALSKLLQPSALKEIDVAIGDWEKIKATFEKRYQSAKAKAKVNQQQLDQIQGLEKRIALLRRQRAELRKSAKALGKPEVEYKQQRNRWNKLLSDKLVALEAQCQKFTALSDGIIRADIRDNLDVAGLVQKLKAAFSGMNIKEEKIERLSQLVGNASDPFSEWNEVLGELEALALHSVEGTNDLPDTPLLNKCSFIESERRRIATQLDTNRWIELSVVELEFNPRFRYCTSKSKDEHINFAEASAGQQATALLTVLLNQSGASLIIDQPEDDIDSKLFEEIVIRVWKAKGCRQLIFASHSANFVVNGDAELVACCDYVKAGDQTRGAIKSVGAIDKQEIREEIILVTEGGRDAFKLRMDQYGF